jgi:predicted Fe-S protein YdhL (DUF1289 family)
MCIATRPAASYILQPVRNPARFHRARRHGPMLSPCVGVCAIAPATGLCTGCGRSLEEIARWSRMTDAERRRIMNELSDRRSQARHSAER